MERNGTTLPFFTFNVHNLQLFLPFPAVAVLYTDIFTDHLKMSVVKPLNKKGDKTDMTNYRPISLWTAFYKVCEKVMYNRLGYHKRTNNISGPEQFACKKGISDEVVAFKLTNRMFKSVNQKMHIRGIFLWFRTTSWPCKAWLFLTDLHFYGIQGIAARFRYYLMDRKWKMKKVT
jgi:hypothetical protein